MRNYQCFRVPCSNDSVPTNKVGPSCIIELSTDLAKSFVPPLLTRTLVYCMELSERRASYTRIIGRCPSLLGSVCQG